MPAIVGRNCGRHDPARWRIGDGAGPTTSGTFRAVGPDQRILEVVVDHRSTGLDTAMRVVTEFGSFWVLWLIGIAVTIGWWQRFGDWLAARVLAITAGTAWASSHLIKWTVDRDRPPLGLRLVDATGSAFPSGHSTQSAAMYGALAVLWAVHQRDPRRRRVALVLAGLVALAVGVSRIYLGVHWTTDVLAGWALGATVVAFVGRRLASTPLTAGASTA